MEILLNIFKEPLQKAMEKKWVKWLAAIAVILMVLIFSIWKIIVFLEFDKDVKRYGRDVVNDRLAVSECEGFHGIKGRVLLPEGYKKDISKINIVAIKKGAVLGSNEKCQYELELDSIYFNQGMKGCVRDQGLTLSLDSDDYEIVPRATRVCQTGFDVKLKSKASL